MVAFWRDVEPRPDPDERPGSARPFPDAARTRYTWPKRLAARSGWGTAAESMPVIPVPVDAVWEETEPAGRPLSARVLPPYDACFQGF